jgi:hypothetical protein
VGVGGSCSHSRCGLRLRCIDRTLCTSHPSHASGRRLLYHSSEPDSVPANYPEARGWIPFLKQVGKKTRQHCALAVSRGRASKASGRVQWMADAGILGDTPVCALHAWGWRLICTFRRHSPILCTTYWLGLPTPSLSGNLNTSPSPHQGECGVL